MQNKLIKAQSMLEYLILFISVVAAGLIGTNAFVGPAMRNGLVNMQNTAANDLINNPNPPASVTSQAYYTPTTTETTVTAENGWVEPSYAGSPGGEPFEANTYYFREGSSDMSHVQPQGSVVESRATTTVPNTMTIENPHTTGGTPYPYNTDWWNNYASDLYWNHDVGK